MHLPFRSSFRLNLCSSFLGNAISTWKDIPAPRTGGFHGWSECLDHFLHVSEKVRRVWFVFKWRSSIGVDQWSQVQELCWGESQVPERLGVETRRGPCDCRFCTNNACFLGGQFRRTGPPIPAFVRTASPNVVPFDLFYVEGFQEKFCLNSGFC